MGNEKTTQLNEIAEFISNMPQLTERYSDIRFVYDVAEMGQNSLVFKARDGRYPIILKFNGSWNNDIYRREAFEREYVLMKLLSGKKGVIQLRGDLERIEFPVQAVSNGPILRYEIVYFPMEVARVDLATLIYLGSKKQSILRLLTIFRSLCRSLKVLHENNICHRDLKPSNVFFFNTENVKIGDLGCARQLGEGVPSLLEVYHGPRGDIRYTAPELICLAKECDEGFLAGDFYSLGAILFEVVTGRIYGDYVYTLENLAKLKAMFSIMPATSREDIFDKLLPDIIAAYPPPPLSEITGKIPASIIYNLEGLYKRLIELRVEKRLVNFNTILRELEIMIRILRYEQKARRQ